jgi:hypothetical protein
VGKASVDVVLEVGRRRTFASALEWPGWSRSGRDEQGAIAALLDYADRYAAVAGRADVPFRPDVEVSVVEKLPGDAGTDFGAPMKVASAELHRLTAREAQRRSALVVAAWSLIDDVAASAPAELRKGPRGGGRDRDAVVAHVVAAETAYARKLGITGRPPDVRAAIVDVLSRASDGSALKDNGWPARYGARRVAWHVLDHAWEIEDRSER